MIGDIRDKNLDNYEYVGVRGFYFKDSGKEKRIEFLKLIHYLWTGDGGNHLRKINYYMNEVKPEKVIIMCIIYLI